MPPLHRLKRDDLWLPAARRPQPEFVVDNETIANLLNLEARVENEFYEPTIARMRQNTFTAFSEYYEYKGGYLSCHDWRPGEFNKQADAACNWILDDRSDIADLDVHDIASRLLTGQVLQLFSDGGYGGASGAAAFVAVCSVLRNDVWHATICGHRGIYMHVAVSSFEAELVAADAAIEFALEVGQMMCQARMFFRPRTSNAPTNGTSELHAST